MAESVEQPQDISTWVTVDVEAAGSWYTIDNPFLAQPRKLSERTLNQCAENTNVVLASKVKQIPFRYRHPEAGAGMCFETDDKVRGLCTKFWVADSTYEPGLKSLWATVTMEPSLAEEIKAGSYPNRSVGLDTGLKLPDGELVLSYCDHLAYYGVTDTAYQNLKPVFSAEKGKQGITKNLLEYMGTGIQKAADYIVNELRGMGDNQRLKRQEMSTRLEREKKRMEKAKAELAKAEATYKKVQLEEEPEEDMPSEEDFSSRLTECESRLEKCEARLAQLEEAPKEEPAPPAEDAPSEEAKDYSADTALQAFDALCSKGKIKMAHKAEFMRDCKKYGVEETFNKHNEKPANPFLERVLHNSPYNPTPQDYRNAKKSASERDAEEAVKAAFEKHMPKKAS